MKPCATSARLLTSARLAMSSCARDDAAVCSAWRTRHSSSVVSSWPMIWPALTASPSRTDSAFTSAATLALTIALLTALSPPETESVRVSSSGRTTIKSLLASSSAPRSTATGVASACSALRATSARCTPKPRTSSASSGRLHFSQRFIGSFASSRAGPTLSCRSALQARAASDRVAWRSSSRAKSRVRAPGRRRTNACSGR